MEEMDKKKIKNEFEKQKNILEYNKKQLIINRKR